MQLPPTSAEPSTLYEISISARELPNLDVSSKTDPCAVLYMKPTGSPNWAEVGRTEVISDSLPIRVVLYDWDHATTTLADQELIGSAETTIGKLVGLGNAQNISISNPARPKNGVITLLGSEVASCNQVARIHMQGAHLDKKDFFGKSDPFFVFSRLQQNQPVAVYRVCITPHQKQHRQLARRIRSIFLFCCSGAVHFVDISGGQSNPVMKTLDPDWPDFQVPLGKLCGGNLEAPFLIEVFDWNKSSEAELIGQAVTSMSQLRVGVQIPLINRQIQAKKGSKYVNSGVLTLTKLEVVQIPSFLDYLSGGCELSLLVAVDFTASNKPPLQPDSLHCMLGPGQNPYQQAVGAVGSIMVPYDSDGLVPPEVVGVPGMLQAYDQAIRTVQLYGPTNFAEVIRKASEYAAQYQTQQQQKYFVLLIITDGAITDTAQTIRAIVAASALPLSIVIIGVGNADFSTMSVLDGDGGVLRDDTGRAAVRDIVQFVPFNQCANLSRLTSETMAEVPGQGFAPVAMMARVAIAGSPQMASMMAAAQAARAVAAFQAGHFPVFLFFSLGFAVVFAKYEQMVEILRR
ncbi:putative Nicotinic receptor-associated protein 1 [Paratrimastix pyriformis]|uniref:Nicotinic receptor-associated protein 1 n=1 Tax=Paratrimastix pyriformis TaxID=342808 RepID=A0ABQ8UIB4_9EUKA|nr:putative Nicotinic receptor-associated protein 1 [Paratrimastix pyriformis]